MPAMPSLADLRAQADVLLYNGKYPDALHVYSALLELSPTSLDVRLRIADALLTNFHLPRSSLLILVSAFAGRDFTLRAYRHAVAQRYRFYSYGDCMLIL